MREPTTGGGFYPDFDESFPDLFPSCDELNLPHRIEEWSATGWNSQNGYGPTLGEWPEEMREPTTGGGFYPDFDESFPDLFPRVATLLNLPPRIEEWLCDRLPSD